MPDYRLQLTRSEDEQDSDLAAFDDELRNEAKLFNEPLGVNIDAVPIDLDGDDPDKSPFDVGVAQPRAISLFKLYSLLKKPVPTEIAAALGKARTPILIVHQMTPFPRFGHTSVRVWGMGYQIQNLPESVVPLDYAPRGELLSVGKAVTETKLSFSASGKFDLMPTAAELASGIPGVSIEGLSYGFGIKNNIVFGFTLKVEMLKIMAGLVGRGVRWDFIEQNDRLETGTKMLQTVLLPEDCRTVQMDVEVWIRRRNALLGFGAARSWRTAPRQMTVDVEA